MGTAIFLPTLGILLTVLACTKPSAAPVIAIAIEEDTIVSVTTPTTDPYPMPAPDSMAFAEDKAVRCGVNQFRYKYCGYASATKDSADWVVLPTFAFFNKGTDFQTGIAKLFTYSESGSPLTCLSFSQFRLAPGVYFPVKNFYPTSAFDFTIHYYHLVEDGCASSNWYVPDTTKVSFLHVIHYDSTRKEIKARFRVHLKARDAPKPGYPETLTFDDGIIFARSIN